MTKQTHFTDHFPRGRIDALTDGIFAVAMTLLVLDIRLPEGLHPLNATDLWRGLHELWPRLVAYALSFLILGLRWLSLAQVPTHAEHVGAAYIRWWMFYLMMITLIPFTTTLVGSHASLAPATWLYCGNTALIAIAAWRMAQLMPGIEDASHIRQRQVSMLVLLASALVCAAWSFADARTALLAFSLNIAAPLISRVSERHRAAQPPP